MTMGQLSDDMARLVGEIQTAHRQRAQLRRNLRQGAAEQHREAVRARASLRAAHADAARRQRKALREFASTLAHGVGHFRNSVATDLVNARRAWTGGSTVTTASRRPRPATGEKHS